MTEEEASEKPCFIPEWLKQYQSELEQAVREEVIKGRMSARRVSKI